MHNKDRYRTVSLIINHRPHDTIAEKKFDELDKLVHYTLTKAGGNEQVDRLQWVRKRSDTERLREQLGQILVTLNTLLNTTSL